MIKKIIEVWYLFIGILKQVCSRLAHPNRKKRYHEMLKDPRWKEKRLEILKRDEYKCIKCGKTTNLHVHHKFYTGNLKPWEYPNDTLITLCRGCHYKEHFLNGKKVR